MIELYVLVSAVGLVAGLSLGMTGLGWGAISVPLLILMGFDPSTAVGTILLSNVLASSVGTFNHWRNHNSDPRLVLPVAVGGIAFGVAGAVFSLSVQPALLASVLSLYLTIGGLGVLKMTSHKSSSGDPPTNRAKFIAAGALPGFFEGAYGSGGPAGVLTLLLLKVQAHRAVGSWLPATVAVQTVPAIIYIATLNIDWLAFLSLLASGLPAVALGSHLSGKVSERVLRRIIGLAVLALGLRLFIRMILG